MKRTIDGPLYTKRTYLFRMYRDAGLPDEMARDIAESVLRADAKMEEIEEEDLRVYYAHRGVE